MNVGFEEEELKPYSEPEADLNDLARIRESHPLPLTTAVCGSPGFSHYYLCSMCM